MTLAKYLSKIIGARVLLCWIVLLILALSIDLLSVASGLLETGGPALLAKYAGLRVPMLGSILVPVAVLIGGVVAFLTLSARSELTIIRAAGKSTRGLLLALAPLSLALGIVNFLLLDTFSAWAERGLAELFPIEVSVEAAGAEVWSRDGESVMRARPVAPDGSELAEITIFGLDDRGHYRDRLDAEHAVYVGGGWKLSGVRRTVGGETEYLGTMRWETRATPSTIFSLSEGQSMVSIDQARAALSGDVLQTRGSAFYETQIMQGYLAFVVPMVMLALASISAFGSQRMGGGARLAIIAAVLAFLYIVTNGTSASLSAVGAIDPILAAVVPSGFFMLIGLWFLLLQES